MKLTTKQNDDLAVRRGKDKEGQFVERGVGHKGVMREHPLLMQGPLVRATLEGRKTQTRRPLRNQPPTGYDLVRVCGPWAEFENDSPPLAKYSTKGPLGETGDRLWVRETWDWRDWQSMANRKVRIAYAADGAQVDTIAPCDWNPVVYNAARWHPSIHMPRWACRLVLPLVSVRVERVQDISEADAIAEGLRCTDFGWTDGTTGYDTVSAREAFRELWDSIYGQESWNANPWVWVAEWKEIEVSR